LSSAFYRGEFGSESNTQADTGSTGENKPEQTKLRQNIVEKSDETIADKSLRK